MRQDVEVRNISDGNQNPAGGWARGLGIDIRWQDGPLREPDGIEHMPNGAFVEDVLEVCQRRIEFYQESRFNCIENAMAISCIQRARDELARRIDRRVAAGIQGTHQEDAQ